MPPIDPPSAESASSEAACVRGTLSDMAADIKALLRGIRDTGTYAFRILHISSQFDEEQETRTIRVDIDAEYKLQGGS